MEKNSLISILILSPSLNSIKSSGHFCPALYFTDPMEEENFLLHWKKKIMEHFLYQGI
jgi:hypothetical protein